jgi:hypothetical protein
MKKKDGAVAMTAEMEMEKVGAMEMLMEMEMVKAKVMVAERQCNDTGQDTAWQMESARKHNNGRMDKTQWLGRW